MPCQGTHAGSGAAEEWACGTHGCCPQEAVSRGWLVLRWGRGWRLLSCAPCPVHSPAGAQRCAGSSGEAPPAAWPRHLCSCVTGWVWLPWDRALGEDSGAQGMRGWGDSGCEGTRGLM